MKKWLLPLLWLTAFQTQAQVTREYFQQEVNYSIDVKLDDEQNMLRGFERIEYINKSPHTLSALYFHLWPNAYKNKNTALAKQLLENGNTSMFFADPATDFGFIDSLLFVVNNDTIKWEYDSTHIDIAILYLKKPVKSKDTIIITTPFRVKIPASFSRLGHVGQSYQITQWYPKPAVYDSNGWNEMPYLNQGEFYSEFGSFDVRITVPKNYVVAATGDLYDCPAEEKWLENKAKETQALFNNNQVDKFGRLQGKYDDTFPASSPEWKTLRYKQKNVHDFGWFADKRFYVLRGEYNLPKSGRNVTSWAFFTSGNSNYWKKSIEYLNDAIKYYSMWNGEYPYNVVSAVDGTISAGGGMEYPTVTVIGDVSSNIELETVIMHEVGHNWFYGILGSNEREHPWMDEGLNSFNELRYLETKYPDLTLLSAMIGRLPNIGNGFGLRNVKQRFQYYYSYLLNARRNYDQPIEEKAENYTSLNYGAIVYAKTAIAFDYLRSYLGEKLFDKCMHAYYDKWKFHHPTPDDLKDVFQSVSQKDLSWFFDDYLKSNDVIDYKIERKKRVDTRSHTTYGWIKYEESVVIANKGNAVVPFCMQGIKGDTVNTEVWYAGHKGKQTVFFPNGPYQYFIIDFNERIPEVDRKNNRMREKGLFKKTEKLKLQFLGGVEEPNRSVLYYSPVLGYNKYDGFMAGLLLHNNIFPTRPVEWQLMPMYGFHSKKPVGYAAFNHRINIRESGWLNSINWGFNASSFDISTYNNGFNKSTTGFYKVSPYVELILKQKNARSPHHHRIKLSDDLIWEKSDITYPTGDGKFSLISDFYYANLDYIYQHSHAIHPFQINFNARNSQDFTQISVEGKIKRIINKKGNYLEARIFAGKFLYNNSTNGRYNWRMDGQHGSNDYTYSQPFIGRTDINGIWSQQFIETHGALKILTANGQSNNWMTAVNLKYNLPVSFINLFADAGLSGDSFNNTTFLYDAGVSFSLFKGLLNIYAPLIYSKIIQDEYKANNWGFFRTIRFSLHLSSANPFKLVKNIQH